MLPPLPVFVADALTTALASTVTVLAIKPAALEACAFATALACN